MAASYATVADVKLAMGSSWDDSNEPLVDKLIEVVSAGIRQIFRNHGRNLDEELAEGTLEEIIVNQVVVDLVVKAAGNEGMPLSGDFSTLQQTAGPYSMSISGISGPLYLRKEQARWLGLSTLAIKTIKVL